jgi:predicted metallo-beta-lactamase superfamily hydrolase
MSIMRNIHCWGLEVRVNMKITILGTESLGVRGFSCFVQVKDRKFVIDPGVALGYRRRGLLPHPAQVAVGEQVRRKIIIALQDATDVVLSHFHGDHIPLSDANPYQLNALQVAPLFAKIRLWCKGPDGLSPHMVSRRTALMEVLDRDLPIAEGQKNDMVEFSMPVPHGDLQMGCNRVMMTRIASEGLVFVHASDIQLLDSEAVEVILTWQPDIVLASGPPIYLAGLSQRQREQAWENGARLANGVDTLILDHHLLRCDTGLCWLDRLSSATGRRVLCAADFMAQPRCLLEARRAQLYEEMPVRKGWHEAYAIGDANTSAFQTYTDICTHRLMNSDLPMSDAMLPDTLVASREKCG